MPGLGDFKDKAMATAEEHDDKIDAGAEKAGEMANERTGGKHEDKIDAGVEKAQNLTGDDNAG